LARVIYSLKRILGAIMKTFVKVMKALSDPNRVKIVKLLQQKVMCVCELRAALNISQPSVSKHLKILEEAGLVDYYKDGLWVNYYLSDGRQSPYAASLMGNIKHWLNDDPQVADLIKKAPSLNREVICKA
jgi:ArsR family transcriptional regulator, arsenate/arsenite/antimonite-responsive transcriptional repressor